VAMWETWIVWGAEGVSRCGVRARGVGVCEVVVGGIACGSERGSDGGGASVAGGGPKGSLSAVLASSSLTSQYVCRVAPTRTQPRRACVHSRRDLPSSDPCAPRSTRRRSPRSTSAGLRRSLRLLSEAPPDLAERESGPDSGTEVRLRPRVKYPVCELTVAVTRHKPETLSGTPGRVFFSA
jgi:hypothetical protein